MTAYVFGRVRKDFLESPTAEFWKRGRGASYFTEDINQASRYDTKSIAKQIASKTAKYFGDYQKGYQYFIAMVDFNE